MFEFISYQVPLDADGENGTLTVSFNGKILKFGPNYYDGSYNPFWYSKRFSPDEGWCFDFRAMPVWIQLHKEELTELFLMNVDPELSELWIDNTWGW